MVMQTEINQARDLILKSDKIVVIPGYDLQGDAFAAGLALFCTLQKLGKKINFAAKDTPKRLEFLQNTETKEVVLTVNSRGKEFKQMRYEKNSEELKIYFALARGDISLSEISLSPVNLQSGLASNNFESAPGLIVTVGAQSLDVISPQTTLEPSLLYEIPILNIDNQITNEGFGNANLIDHGAASLSEIAADLIAAINPALLDKKICTQLLTGLICATDNFQHPRTSPRTLAKAALLLEHGAEHEKIIRNLYKTKTLAQVRLLGRALQNLRLIQEKELALTTLTKQDFEETAANSRDLAQVLEDIKTNFPQFPSLILLWESHGSDPLIKGIVSCRNSIMTNRIVENFEGVSRNNTVLFIIREEELKKAEEEILKIL